MPRKPPSPAPRAPRGTATAQFLVRLSPEEKAAVQRAARASGLTLAEWLRQALQRAVEAQP